MNKSKIFRPPPSGEVQNLSPPPFHVVRFRCPPSPLSLPQPMNNEASLRPYGFCDFPFLFAMNLDLNILVCKNLCMEGNFLTTNWWHLTKYLGHYHFIFVIWRFLFAINNLDLQEKSEREIFDNYFGKFDKNLYPFISSLAFSHIFSCRKYFGWRNWCCLFRKNLISFEENACLTYFLFGCITFKRGFPFVPTVPPGQNDLP